MRCMIWNILGKRAEHPYVVNSGVDVVAAVSSESSHSGVSSSARRSFVLSRLLTSFSCGDIRRRLINKDR